MESGQVFFRARSSLTQTWPVSTAGVSRELDGPAGTPHTGAVAAALLALLLSAAPPRTVVVLGGDVIPHESLKAAARASSAPKSRQAGPPGSLPSPWSDWLVPLGGVFRAADVVLVNLETPVTARHDARVGGYLFAAPPELLAGLRAAGITAVGFANNHARDQHLQGIVETRAHALDAGLPVVGAAESAAAAWEPLVLERNGVRVGFLAFTRFLNRFQNRRDPEAPHVPFVPYPGEPLDHGTRVPQLLAHVRRAAARCDALVVFPHWGDERAAGPRADDVALAHALVDAGALAVVGAHPHVPQRVEPLGDGGAVVAWSLGNLVANQEPTDEDAPERSGLLLRLELEARDGGTALAGWEALPVQVDNAPAPGGRRVQARLLREVVAERERDVEAAAAGARPLAEARLRAARARLERLQALSAEGTARSTPPSPRARAPAGPPGPR